MKIISFVCLLVLFCSAPPVPAGDAVIQTGDLATLVVTQPLTPRSIDARMPLRMEITSITSTPIYVDSIRAELAEGLTNTRIALNSETAFYRKIEADNTLNLGETFRHTFELPPQSFDWCRPFAQPGLLFFTGGKHTVKLIADVKDDLHKPSRRLEKTVEVEFVPAPAALIFGGLAGSLLLVVFERLFRLSQKLNRPDWPRRADGSLDWSRIHRASSAWLFSEGPSGVVQVTLGGLTVVLFLVLVGLGQGKDLPISFKVDGFFSALGVGLFMHFVVVAIYKKLVPPVPAPIPVARQASLIEVEVIPPPAGVIQERAET